MKLYGDRPGTAVTQLFTDLLVVAWVWFWIWAATRLYDLVGKLGTPGAKLESAGNGMAGGLTDAGRKVDNLPGVGDALATPFTRAAQAAQAVADAGREQQNAVHELALVLTALLLVVPLGLVLFGWLPLRLRWISRASAAASLRGGVAGRDLLALRALATQPLRRLAAIDPDVSAAWRRGDPSTVEALAALELRGLGLRVPKR